MSVYSKPTAILRSGTRSWQRVLALTACAILGGTLLRLSLPPLRAATCLPLGLAVVLAAVDDDDPAWVHGWVGLCCGIMWHSFVPIGVLSWGLPLVVLTWLVPSLSLSSAFALSVTVRTFLGRGSAASVLAFPTAWVLLSSLGDWVGAPVALSVGWIERPSWLAIARYLGTAGTDGLIATIAACAAHVVRGVLSGGLHGLRFVTAASIGPVFVLCAASWMSSPVDIGRLQVHAIDAAISPEASKRARLSLFERNRIERRIDVLVERAAARAPGVIVLPEGGNGQFNARIRRRREATIGLLRGTTSELLLSSPDLAPDHSLYNTVHHVTASGFGRVARKANTVLLAESSLDEGEPATLDTRWGRIGIAVCYDAVFGSHARALADAGAQVIVVVSDDASFGRSFLADVHLAYSRLRALEVGRGLLFLSNLGPVASVSPDGTLLRRPSTGRTEAIHSLQVPLVDGDSATIEGHWIVPVLLIVIVYRAFRLVVRGDFSRATLAGTRTRLPVRVPKLALFAASVLTLVSAFASEVSMLASFSLSSLDDAINAMEQSLRPERVMSSLPALFKQRGEVDCGPEALAFAMTLMGDEVFGPELVRRRPVNDARGYSLSSLAELARDRGFAAEGFTGDLEALPGTGRPPIIAHLASGHFVTVLSRDAGHVSFFDPGTGDIHEVSEARFLAAWSRRYLSLGTRDM